MLIDFPNAALRSLADPDQICELLPSANQPSILGASLRATRSRFERFHSRVRFPPPPPEPPRTSVDFRGSPRKKLEQIPICVNSIPRFRNRISVFKRPSTARKEDEAVGVNVALLGDRPRRSISIRGQPRNLGATLGASRRHQNQLPPTRSERQ